MAYRVTLKKGAVKALERISEPFYSSIKKAIYGLAKEPRPKGYKKLKGRDAYRIRVADYRIIYEVFDNILLIDVIDVDHRSNIYK